VEGSTYTVQLDNFAGPLDLLLQLIERNKLDICDISLATVTNDYLESIQNIELDPAQANWFLDIASRLILYKSRALLPNKDQDTQEPLEDLTEQLQELSAIRNTMKQVVEAARPSFQFAKKPSTPINPTVFTNLDFSSFAEFYPAKQTQPQPTTKPFKLKRQNPIYLRKKLQSMWQSSQQLDISKLHTYCDSHYETVVCFLLALEMLKDNKAKIVDNNTSVMVKLI